MLAPAVAIAASAPRQRKEIVHERQTKETELGEWLDVPLQLPGDEQGSGGQHGSEQLAENDDDCTDDAPAAHAVHTRNRSISWSPSHCESWLIKQPEKKGSSFFGGGGFAFARKRWFVLESGAITYYYDEAKKRPIKTFSVDGLRIVKHSERAGSCKRTFELILDWNLATQQQNTGSYALTVDSLGLWDMWMNALESAGVALFDWHEVDERKAHIRACTRLEDEPCEIRRSGSEPER
jgi:hypothetical protein